MAKFSESAKVDAADGCFRGAAEGIVKNAIERVTATGIPQMTLVSLKDCRQPSVNLWLGRACLVLLLAMVGAGRFAAQTLRTSATLEGTVSDASGGRITDVKVSLRLIE